jgi:glycosyltransferase involved in cell wall biosynthesis
MTEVSKKFSRLLEICKILRDKNLKFRVLAIGNGVDYEKYTQYVKDNNLQNYVNFLGEKSNPYPYFKISDALVLVSENEGYPVVYNEARVLKLPIITTNVSDSKQDIDGKYGIVCEQDINSIASVMEELIVKGSNNLFKSMEVFDSQKYNEDIKNIIDNIINERN